jgi:hypothetical protein
MGTPRPEITDLIARYCTQLSALGIRVDRAILFGSHARGEAKEGSDIDVLIVSSDFATLNTRQRMEQLGTAAARLGSLSRPLRVPRLSWCMWNPPHFWKKSCRQGDKSLDRENGLPGSLCAMAVLFGKPEATRRVGFGVELDEHGHRIANDPRIVSGLQHYGLWRDELEGAAIRIRALHVPLEQKANVRMHAERRFHQRFEVR